MYIVPMLYSLCSWSFILLMRKNKHDYLGNIMEALHYRTEKVRGVKVLIIWLKRQLNSGNMKKNSKHYSYGCNSSNQTIYRAPLRQSTQMSPLEIWNLKFYWKENLTFDFAVSVIANAWETANRGVKRAIFGAPMQVVHTCVVLLFLKTSETIWCH